MHLQHVLLYHHLHDTAPGNHVLVFHMQVHAERHASKWHKLPSSITSQTLLHVGRDRLRPSPAGSLPHTTIGTQPLEDFAEAAEQQHVFRQGNPHCSHGTL